VDTRFDYMDADDYWLVCTILGQRDISPLYGIVDEEAGGYIAFTNSEVQAKLIVDALRGE
jgi:hypothetical protein